jgi:hypothetical protein
VGVWVLVMCVCVCMRGFCNVWVCVCVGFVICVSCIHRALYCLYCGCCIVLFMYACFLCTVTSDN